MENKRTATMADKELTKETQPQEQIVYISNVALVKMIKHGKDESPYRVAGCLLGAFIDDFTVRVDEVCALPGTADIIFATSELLFKQRVLDFLNKTARTKLVVGFYVSRPGSGGWLSRTDCDILQTYAEKNPRCIAVVVEPAWSVIEKVVNDTWEVNGDEGKCWKFLSCVGLFNVVWCLRRLLKIGDKEKDSDRDIGKVVIDAFRLLKLKVVERDPEQRQTPSMPGHLVIQSTKALCNEAERHYYSISIKYWRNEVSKKKERATQLRRNKVTMANKKELMYSTDEETEGTSPQEQKLDISNIALVKMIKHGKDELPCRVSGCLLGYYVDDFTVRVDDVCMLPGTADVISDSSELLFKERILDLLQKIATPKQVVGFYISRPGCGGWLSRTDCDILQRYEEKNQRCIAVVVDPAGSVIEKVVSNKGKAVNDEGKCWKFLPFMGLFNVNWILQWLLNLSDQEKDAVSDKGKVVIDAFRLPKPKVLLRDPEPRDRPAKPGYLTIPSIKALRNELERHYYSIAIKYWKNKGIQSHTQRYSVQR